MNWLPAGKKMKELKKMAREMRIRPREVKEGFWKLEEEGGDKEKEGEGKVDGDGGGGGAERMDVDG